MESNELIREGSILLIDGLRGIHIPQYFAQQWAARIKGYVKGSTDDLSESVNICLYGEEHDEYWAAWDDVLRSAVLTIDGKQYRLEQDGDLWAVPVETTDQEDKAEADRLQHEAGAPMLKDVVMADCERLYQQGGADAVYQYANHLGLKYSDCTRCESETPTIHGDCAVCGSTKL